MEGFLTGEVLLNIGMGGLCALTLFVLLVVFKGYQKIMTNHLHDNHLDKQEDVKSREQLSAVLGKLCEKIDKVSDKP